MPWLFSQRTMKYNCLNIPSEDKQATGTLFRKGIKEMKTRTIIIAKLKIKNNSNGLLSKENKRLL